MVHRTEPFLQLVDEDMSKVVKGEQKERYAALKLQLEQYKDLHPGELPVASVMSELKMPPIETNTLGGGVVGKPIRKVDPSFLTILNDAPPQVQPTAATTGRRTALAN